MIGLALALLTFLAAGFAAVDVLRPDLARGRAGRVGIALLLGPGVVAFLFFVGALAGWPIGRGLGAAVSAVALLAPLAVRSARRRGKDRAERPGGATEDGAGAAVPPAPPPPAAALAAWAVPVALGAVFAWSFPPVMDALCNWSLKVKAFVHDRTLLSPDLLEPDRLHFHPNYPLLVPLAQTHASVLAGRTEDRRAKVFSALLHLGAVLLLYEFLARRIDRRRAAVAAFLLAALPHFYGTTRAFRFAGSVPSGYADPAFAALAGGALLALAHGIARGRGRDVLLAALLLGLSVFTKNEGLPMTIAAGLGGAVCLALAVRRGVARPSGRTVAVAGLLFLAVAGPWLAHRSRLPERDENYHRRIVDPDEWRRGAWRTPTILVVTAQEALAADRQALVWPLLLAGLWIGRRRLREPEAACLLAALAAMAAVYFAVFVVTPLFILDSLYTSIPRTFFQLSVPAVALAGLLLGRPLGGTDGGPAGR